MHGERPLGCGPPADPSACLLVFSIGRPWRGRGAGAASTPDNDGESPPSENLSPSPENCGGFKNWSPCSPHPNFSCLSLSEPHPITSCRARSSANSLVSLSTASVLRWRSLCSSTRVAWQGVNRPGFGGGPNS